MKPPADDIESRLPVWEALGEFFLDNEPQLDYVIRVCAESPYSLSELDQILFSELWPALNLNLMPVAGEWAGWDREWLVRRVLEKHEKGSSQFWWINPLKRYFCADWPRVRDAIKQRREQAPPTSTDEA